MNLRTLGLLLLAPVTLWLSARTVDASLVIEWTATNEATVADFSQTVANVGGIDFFALQNIDNGFGSATGISGSNSLAGQSPGDLTFEFGDLEQVAFSQGVSGGPPTVQTYAEGDAGPNFIHFLLNGQLIAIGEYVETVVTTDFDTGIATAVGSIQLVSPGADPTFFNEIMTLTAGTGIVLVETDTFIGTSLQTDPDPNNWIATFDTSGRFVVEAVPEPASLWLGGMAFVGLLFRSRQRKLLRIDR